LGLGQYRHYAAVLVHLRIAKALSANVSGEMKWASQVGVWGASLLAAFVVYVLSFGPVLYLMNIGRVPRALYPPISVVYAPIPWVRQVPFVNRFMNGYMGWWDDLAMESG
jgi:hypothetical protein